MEVIREWEWRREEKIRRKEEHQMKGGGGAEGGIEMGERRPMSKIEKTSKVYRVGKTSEYIVFATCASFG